MCLLGKCIGASQKTYNKFGVATTCKSCNRFLIVLYLMNSFHYLCLRSNYSCFQLENSNPKHIFFPFQTASSSGDPHVHIIKQVKPTDEGLYTCIAGNVLGQATASAYLEVSRGIGQHSYDSCYVLFLLLLLLNAQNQLWNYRLRRPLVLEHSWTKWTLNFDVFSLLPRTLCQILSFVCEKTIDVCMKNKRRRSNIEQDFYNKSHTELWTQKGAESLL